MAKRKPKTETETDTAATSTTAASTAASAAPAVDAEFIPDAELGIQPAHRVDNDAFTSHDDYAGMVLRNLALEDIQVDDARNSRLLPFDEKEIKELAESIMRRQLQPVGVRSVLIGGGEGYEAVFGFRRLAAIRYANEHLGASLTVWAIVFRSSDEEAAYFNLDENLRRKDLSVIEVAHAADRLLKLGMTGKQVAEKMGGRNRGSVFQLSALLKLRPHLQKLIHTGKLNFTQGRALHGLTDAEQDKLVGSMLKGLTGNVASDQRSKLRKAKGKLQVHKGRKKGKLTAAKATEMLTEFAVLPAPAKGKAKNAKPPKKEPDARVRARKVVSAVLQFLNGKLAPAKMFAEIEKLAA